MKFFHLTIALILTILASCTSDKENNTQNVQKTTIDTTQYSLTYLEAIHKRKTFKNYDNSLTSYINSQPNKPDSVRKIIYLLPLGNMSPEVEKIIKTEVWYLSLFFQLEVRLLDRIPFNEIKNRKVVTRFVPSNDYEYYGKFKNRTVDLKEQIEANSLMGYYIKEIMPKDAIAVLGITEHDLYIPNMNYIFGTSYLKNRIGLISTYRIAENDFESKINIRKVVTKQIVNLFSIPNVKDYECVLNYHNSLNELRNGVLYISPKALEKLKYSIGFDYNKRFSDLRMYYKKEENEPMAEYYNKCIQLSQTSSNQKDPSKQ